MQKTTICPNCGVGAMDIFYRVHHVPAHSVLLLDTREEALSYPTGEITLGFCPLCAFVSNTTYDAGLQEYAERYEATQSFSSTFNAFALELAENLIDRYDLRGKTIVEIGCGQGEFLLQLCELGENRGIGFDPAYRGEPSESEARDRVQFVADFYSEKYSAYGGDLICCKMTLEHIGDPYEFVSNVRRAVNDNDDAIIFFQVPNASYVLRSLAFWDVYYEHCSYFTPESLTYLFERCGFDVLRVYTAYQDQYLMIEAKPASYSAPAAVDPMALQITCRDVERFAGQLPEMFGYWQRELDAIEQRGERVVIWGGGSKGVSFLTTLGINDQIQYVVDINPRKHGMFMAGTGQEIVSPEFLKEYRPDVVIVMNPVYCPEISRSISEMGLTARLMPVEWAD